MNKYHGLVIIILFSTSLAASSDAKKLSSYRIAAALSTTSLPPSLITLVLEYGPWFFITGKARAHHYRSLNKPILYTSLTAGPDSIKIDRVYEKSKTTYTNARGHSCTTTTYGYAADYLDSTTFTNIVDPHVLSHSDKEHDQTKHDQTKKTIQDKTNELRAIAGQRITDDELTKAEIAAAISFDQKNLFVTLAPLDNTLGLGPAMWRDWTTKEQERANDFQPRILVYPISFEPPVSSRSKKMVKKPSGATSLTDEATVHCSIS